MLCLRINERTPFAGNVFNFPRIRSFILRHNIRLYLAEQCCWADQLNKGLSGVRRKAPAPFLGEGAAVMWSPYPTSLRNIFRKFLNRICSVKHDLSPMVRGLC
jgi:hypothetical protein